jgi:hypothetical protein
MKHYLDIFIEDRPMDTKYLHVLDKSVYHDRLPIENPVLKVEVPNKSGFVLPRFSVGEDNVYTTRSLKYYKDTKTLFDLPDGIYIITYSICPNDETYVKKYHLRTAVLENKLDNLISELLSVCEPIINSSNSIDNENLMNELILCTTILKSAKIAASNGNIAMAVKLYCKVEKLINDYVLRTNK